MSSSMWYSTFMVIALPKMMEATAMSEPAASVETPVTPCPIVQPRASTPPNPINRPPARWLTISARVLNVSMRKLPEATA